MEVSEIKDRDSLRAWLEALPQETEAEKEEARRWAVMIAHRAAMRVLPLVWSWASTERAEMLGVNVLAVLRAALIAPMISKNSTSLGASRASNNIVSEILDSTFVSNPAYRASVAWLDLLSAAARHGFGNMAYAVPPIVGLVEESSPNTLQLWDMTRADCAALQQGQTLNRLPLWQGDNALTQLWADTKSKILAQGDGWRFWVDWYENALHGRPQDYDLLTKIALIDPKDWDKGANHVNALIQQILEQHRLAGEARALKEEVGRLKAELQSVQHRSHNNPPELVDETIAAQKSVTIIWAALDEAEKELEKPKPDPGRLAGIGQILFDAIKAVSGYCVSLADTAAKASVKTFATGITALALAAHNERLFAFVEALGQFARSLGK